MLHLSLHLTKNKINKVVQPQLLRQCHEFSTIVLLTMLKFVVSCLVLVAVSPGTSPRAVICTKEMSSTKVAEQKVLHGVPKEIHRLQDVKGITNLRRFLCFFHGIFTTARKITNTTGEE